MAFYFGGGGGALWYGGVLTISSTHRIARKNSPVLIYVSIYASEFLHIHDPPGCFGIKE